MLPNIHQNVHQHVAHRARRRERPGVIPVTEDTSSATEGAIHPARHPDRESSNTARQGTPIGGLRDEVNVIILRAELDDAEAVAGRLRERVSHRREDPGGAEAAQGFDRAERDVYGVRGNVRRT
jgi:hypothetical protein